MKKIRLLYVEDSHFDRDLVKVHFEENAPDFKLEIVETGEQCFEKLKTNEYDILYSFVFSFSKHCSPVSKN